MNRQPERNRPHSKIPLSVNRSKLGIPHKSQLCRLFQKGKCYYGHNCHYAHSATELRNRPASTEVHDDKSRRKPNLRKTGLCWQWERFGSCPFGFRCYYAHGNEELQEMTQTSGLPAPPDTAAEPSDDVGTKIAEKLRLKNRSYFTNWDVDTVGRIYADN